MEQRTTVAIDLAKEVFAVCVMNAAGVVIERHRLRRAAFERWLSTLCEPCVIAMEACSSAHHWGRLLAARGHTVRLMAPAFVTPFRKSGKNDEHDAEAIAHRRASADDAFRAGENQRGANHPVLAPRAPGLDRGAQRADRSPARPAGRVRHRHRPLGRSVAPRLAPVERLGVVARAAAASGVRSHRTAARPRCAARPLRCRSRPAHARAEPAAQRLRQMLGVGPLTSSAVLAAVPDARVFRNGRRFSAWLGITPRQHSSGGKTKLGRTTGHGNAYLRTRFVQGARSALQSALRREPAKAAHLQRWIVALYQRKGYHKTLVAIANQHARIAWALLARNEHYDPNAWQRSARIPRDANSHTVAALA